MRKLLYGRDYTCRKGNPLLSADPQVTADICTEKSPSNSIPVPYGSVPPLADNIENGGGSSSFSMKGTSLDNSSPPPTVGLRWGRIVLFLLAMVYGSLNVSMRLVFARPDPPTASVSSTIQGWFAVLCFLPLLGWRPHHQHKSPLALDDQKRTIAQNSNNSNNNNSKVPKFPHMWRFALDLALLNFGTQALMNTSLVWIEGARNSFLVQTSVVWTPFISVWVVQDNKFLF